jgi:hypothetical protein
MALALSFSLSAYAEVTVNGDLQATVVPTIVVSPINPITFNDIDPADTSSNDKQTIPGWQITTTDSSTSGKLVVTTTVDQWNPGGGSYMQLQSPPAGANTSSTRLYYGIVYFDCVGTPYSLVGNSNPTVVYIPFRPNADPNNCTSSKLVFVRNALSDMTPLSGTYTGHVTITVSEQ